MLTIEVIVMKINGSCFGHHIKRTLKTSILASFLFTSAYSPCMLNNIAKTHHIIRNNYKHLSLVNGAIGWETSAIRRLYDYGEIFPVYREDKQNRKFIDHYENPEKTHQTVRLTHAMFYRIPGSMEEACFGPTTQLYDHNPLIGVQTLAKILALCEDVQLDQTTDITPNAETCEQQITAIKNQFHAFLKPQARLGADMGHVTLNALQESDPQNKKYSYPEHTVQTILLAFVYKKYSDDRNLLNSFYGELNNHLNRKLLIPDINHTAWLKEAFKPVNQATALKEVEAIISAHNGIQKQPDNANFFSSLLKKVETFLFGYRPPEDTRQNLDALVYYANQIHSFPTPFGYQSAIYEYAQNKKTPSFSDCMESAVRNFINTCAYDVQNNQFSAHAVKRRIGLPHIHPILDNYLQTSSHVNMASSARAHNAWINVVSHIPYVNYKRMIDETDGKSSVRVQDKGYVAIPEAVQNDALLDWLTKNGYQLCTPNQRGYELRSSVKNIIILLNHLLQLNLFTDTNRLAQEVHAP